MEVQDGKFKKSLICSSTVYSVSSGGVTETVLKCGRPQQKNKHWQCLWSELLSGNENIMHVHMLYESIHTNNQKNHTL